MTVKTLSPNPYIKKKKVGRPPKDPVLEALKKPIKI